MNLTPALANEFDQLKMQLRGYEVARALDDGSWEVHAKYRPTEYDRKRALRDSNWLQWRANQRKDEQTYRVRPVVSIEVDWATGPALETAPQVFTNALVPVQDFGDIIPVNKLDPDAFIVQPPDGYEGTGFAVVGKPEIPFDYAQQAADSKFDFGGL